MLPDCNLEFLGRADQQVKIHGIRVELGEVEATLAQYPGVRAVAVACRAEGGENRWRAYMVAEAPPAVGELLRFLSELLPAAMVPSAFVALEALPLTPSGKVDRAALPAPPDGRPDLGQPAVLPRTELEQQLAGLWEEILQVRPVGVTDSFTDLGGDSLRAVDMLLQVRKRLGKNPPTLCLGREVTVEQLAALLDPVDRLEPLSAVVPLQPHGHKPPLYLVHAIGGEVSCFTRLARQLDPEQP